MFRQRWARYCPSKPILSSFIALALVYSVAPTVHAVNPGTGQTSQGQTLNIQIDEAVHGSTYKTGEPIRVAGTTAIGPLATQAALLYIVDVSGSTQSPMGQDCDGSGTVDDDDDVNNDGFLGDTLDCEISGVTALNKSLAATSVISTGLVLFGTEAAVADVSPNSGSQPFTSTADADHDSNGLNDLEEVAASLGSGKVGLYNNKFVDVGTSFDNAIEAMNQAFSSVTSDTNVALFLSDGMSDVNTTEGSPLAEAKSLGTIINTFSVGAKATGCAVLSALRTIADETGGICTEVADPAQLVTVLPSTPPAEIDRVEVVAGGSGVLTTTLNAAGIWSTEVPGNAVAFPLPVTATVYATDGTAVVADAILEATMALDVVDEPVLDNGTQNLLLPSIFLPLFQ